MKFKVPLISLVVVMCAGAAMATDFGAHVGYYTSDLKAVFVGVDLMVPVGPAYIVPNLDYSKKSGIGYWFGSVDLDLRYKPTGGPGFWFGAGPTYGYFTGYGEEYEGGTEKEWGWDVNGGVGWAMGGLKPYATIRYLKIKDFRSTGAAIGLRF